MSSLAQNSPLISCLSCLCVFLSFLHCLFPIRLTGTCSFYSITRASLSSFIFCFVSFRCFFFIVSKSFCFCLAGSGATEEEHDRVPGGGEYSYPGCSGTDRWLPAQRWGWARQLEEPRCQPLQWLLQLQRWSRTLRQGNPDHMTVVHFLLAMG